MGEVATVSVSLVIPTHNRHDSLKRTLDALSRQTFPLGKLEVVVVADGCTDNTVLMLHNYMPGFSLRVVEQSGLGAAYARNAGAADARGSLIIFLDDDIEANPGLIQEHVNAHQGMENGVVIGYVPPILSTQQGFFKLKLREWWENMFYLMRQKDHRFNYRDLLTGNVSVSRVLFQAVEGFNTSFKCQEDYEIGIRLLNAGAQFAFAPDAIGYHHEVTDVNRALQRKVAEGEAAVQFCRTYPEIIYSIPNLSNLVRGRSRYKRLMLLMIYHLPAVSDFIAHSLRPLLNLLEGLRMRRAWDELLGRLLTYWFMRGVGNATCNLSELTRVLKRQPAECEISIGATIRVDIGAGLESAEKLIDQVRPVRIELRYKQFLLGSIDVKYGFERLRGVHLRAALAKEFSNSLLEALAFSGEPALLRLPQVRELIVATRAKKYVS